MATLHQNCLAIPEQREHEIGVSQLECRSSHTTGQISAVSFEYSRLIRRFRRVAINPLSSVLVSPNVIGCIGFR